MNPVKRCYGDGAKKGGDEGCDGGADDDGGSFPVPVWRGVVSAFVRCFFPCFSVWVSSLVTGRSCMFVRTLGRTSVPLFRPRAFAPSAGNHGYDAGDRRCLHFGSAVAWDRDRFHLFVSNSIVSYRTSCRVLSRGGAVSE